MLARQSKSNSGKTLDCASHTKIRWADQSTEKQPCTLNCGNFNHPENN